MCPRPSARRRHRSDRGCHSSREGEMDGLAGSFPETERAVVPMNVSRSRQGDQRGRAPTRDTADAPLLLHVTDAARLLGIGTTLAYDLVGRGVLPHVRLGRAVRVPRAALEAWIAATPASCRRRAYRRPIPRRFRGDLEPLDIGDTKRLSCPGRARERVRGAECRGLEGATAKGPSTSARTPGCGSRR